MSDHLFEDVIQPKPLDTQEFDRLVTERLNLLENANNNHLVIAYSPFRWDTLSHVQAIKMWDDNGYRVEWATNTGEDNIRRGLKLYNKDHMSEEDAIQVFKKVLVDYEMPDKSEWEDETDISMYTGWAYYTIQDYSSIKTPTELEDITYVEALKYVIREVDGPKEYVLDAMKKLAWFYGNKKEFELERKYIEMVADEGDSDAACELGYMWYYGQHGEVNYAKAYHYFKEGVKGNSENALYSKYKIADMYRFGLHVEKDEQKYQDMIYELFDEIGEPKTTGTPFAEVAYRVAGIEADKGNVEKAVDLLVRAKNFLAERLYHDHYWGSIDIMQRIVNKLYELTEFDENWFNFYDMIHLAGSDRLVEFFYEGEIHRIEFEQGGDVALDGKWYRDVGAFLEKCSLGGQRITAVYDELGRMVIV